ncbi:hypothetical protein GLOTRDRAFT_137659 [Gloeophyllum trabeum ATCC 11539]|uniref:Uncharacterized protein n=1 Tax=Gloeophyllum trabeum (strain ATCC 11539 / FP-39264 / Madison 617) TaxID=670483 RepID=S7RRN9_GLOTA|nr:uncharacterized protein GLOTRDRAFT_137659 [Gloeophyllum trabeum ATCC 11539]EPQ57305.1 hypothetical protein GLOTRDRAFT_137659 [Gloeophyllum trabeum ATCC 11539]
MRWIDVLPLATGALQVVGADLQFPVFSHPELFGTGYFAAPFKVSSNLTGANYIFNALAGLLQQLPNNLHPHGHTIVPATIDAFTLLYHARPVKSDPPSPEWLAFDPEMSYSIMSGIPWGDGTHLSTYAAKRDLKVLYFDGESAVLNGDGALDTQEVVIERRGQVPPPGRGWWDEYFRAERLCKWVKDSGLDVDGFIRMNAGFEVMWCDFSVGLELISHLNITAPETPPLKDAPFPFPPPRHPTDDMQLNELELTTSVMVKNEVVAMDELPTRPPRRGPGSGRRPPWDRWERSPYVASSGFEWLRIATRRYQRPQPHVRLITSGLVTFYDPQFTSLIPTRTGSSMVQHRVWANVSEEDVNKAVDQLEEVLRRDDLWTRRGIDWNLKAWDVMENWGDRLAQMREVLRDDENRNDSAKVEEVRLLAYTLLDPYLDTGNMPRYFNESDPDCWLPPTMSRCTSGQTITIPLHLLTSQERLLKASIETVLHNLCQMAGQILVSSMQAGSIEKNKELAAAWGQEVSELMDWLDWPMWVRCDEVCGWDSVCSVPTWPIWGRPRGGPDSDIFKPKCIQFEDWIHHPRGWF